MPWQWLRGCLLGEIGAVKPLGFFRAAVGGGMAKASPVALPVAAEVAGVRGLTMTIVKTTMWPHRGFMNKILLAASASIAVAERLSVGWHGARHGHYDGDGAGDNDGTGTGQGWPNPLDGPGSPLGYGYASGRAILRTGPGPAPGDGYGKGRFPIGFELLT